jgi:hypothetical protein
MRRFDKHASATNRLMERFASEAESQMVSATSSSKLYRNSRSATLSLP